MNTELIVLLLILILVVFIFIYIEPLFMKHKVKSDNEYGSARFSKINEIKKNFKREKTNNIKEANDILGKLSQSFKIENIEKKVRNKKAKPPFITSTLQQEASKKLGMSAKKSMMIAQKLYEGIDIGKDTVGLITYMRTDSKRLSGEFTTSAFKYIESEYGKEYLGTIKTNKKEIKVQDAHEAIRPTDILKEPLKIKPYLSNDEYKLYRMIYYRALASLMASAKTNNTTVILDNNNYQFKTTGQVLIFPGYLKVYSDYEEIKDSLLPPLEDYKSNLLVSNEIVKEQHFTKPPARYTEARLIKEMEELGIGRPSTYTKTMDTIKNRGYVTIIEKRFNPTSIGIEITDKLQEFFSHIINVLYTAKMEKDLDKIADGKIIWSNVLKKFYQEFEKAVEEAFLKMEKKEPEKTGEMCPQCQHPLVIRNGKYGQFVACSNFPECKYIKSEPREVVEICDCPNCGGKIVEKKTRRGKIFYGCNNYPQCKTAYWDKPVGTKCQECQGMMVEKKGIIKCSSCGHEK